MEEEPPYQITITRVTGDQPVAEAPLRNAVEAALRRHDKTAARISVALVDDAVMTRLNRAYLGRDSTTDVLAFDLSEDPGDGARVEGELVLSVDTAAREAADRGHGVEAELALYAAHGVLHLLGYKDGQEDMAARMHEMEDEILSSIGIGAIYRDKPT